MTSAISSAANAPVPLSTTNLDSRIDNIPIPLRFEKIDEIDTKTQDALIPYFAMQFTTVPTSGSKLECGLHALSISFQAAQNALRKPGTPEHLLIPIWQWREWLDSDLYKSACHEMAILQPGLQTNLERQDWARDLMASRNNLENAEISCLLRVANLKCDTDFQLGFVFTGWRGRIDPRNKLKYDNKFLLETRAAMSDREMGNGPMLWIFNNNSRAAQLARRGFTHSTYNHWVGSRPEATKGNMKKMG